MPALPSRHRRLDDILADLAIDDETMLLSELDGYLTGIAICPEPPMASEWLPGIWGGLPGEAVPFEDPIDGEIFVDMVSARHDEILRGLGRNKLQPIFDVDGRNGEVLWPVWIDGFAAAMALRPESWSAAADGTDAADALSRLLLLIDVARDASSLTGEEINAVYDEAPTAIAGHVTRLHAWRVAQAGTAPLGGASRDQPGKVGRNDPCPCGSGRKSKRCCGG